MNKMNIRDYHHIYMIGIGGISMSGLAEILRVWHYEVSGSDRVSSLQTEDLKQHGIQVFIPQQKENITDDILDDCGMVHFCSVSLVDSPMKEAHRALLELALKKHVWISFDPNLRLSLWDDHEALYQTIHEFLPYADILKLSDEELSFITGKHQIEEALPMLFAHRCKCVIYTKGKDGATLYRRNEQISAKGHQVQVIDTTGAGDSFIGAFLYCLLKEGIDDFDQISSESMKHHLEFANLYAAHTTTLAGALAAMANHEQLRAFQHMLEDDED